MAVVLDQGYGEKSVPSADKQAEEAISQDENRQNIKLCSESLSWKRRLYTFITVCIQCRSTSLYEFDGFQPDVVATISLSD